MKMPRTHAILLLLVCMSLGFNLIIPLFDRRLTVSAGSTTFGYTSVGATTLSYDSQNLFGSWFTTPAYDDIEAVNITVRVRTDIGVSDLPLRCGIYEYDSSTDAGALVAETEEILLPETTGGAWFTCDFSSPVPLSSSTEYFLVAETDYTGDGGGMFYGTAESEKGVSISYYGALPDPLEGEDAINYKVSIYAGITYTLAPASPVGPNVTQMVNSILVDPTRLVNATYADTSGNNTQANITTGLGNLFIPTNGLTALLLSTGYAGKTATTGCTDPGSEVGNWFAGGESGLPRDNATLTMILNVPWNAHYITMDVLFATMETPEYSGAPRDNFTITCVSPLYGTSTSTLNAACGDMASTSGDIAMLGSGYDLFATDHNPAGYDMVSTTDNGHDDAAATAQNEYQFSVRPDEQITLVFKITDGTNNSMDSQAFIDNVRFSGAVPVVTTIASGWNRFVGQRGVWTSYASGWNTFANSSSWRWSPPSSWYNAAWKYRSKIIIDHTKVAASPLSNFPVMIYNISITNFALAQADGDDFLFTNAAGTKLDHEIEYFNQPSGKLVAWVEVPTISSTTDTTLYMYYGNPSCTSQQSVTGTWASNNWKAIYHMNNAPTGTVYDSTSNDNDMTSYGSMTASDLVNGTYGRAIDFDGGNDHMTAARSATMEPSSVSMLVRWYPRTGTSYRAISKRCQDIFNNYDAASYGINFYDKNMTGDYETNDNNANQPYKGLYTINNWFFQSTTHNGIAGGSSVLYVNGIAGSPGVNPVHVLRYLTSSNGKFIVAATWTGGGGGPGPNMHTSCIVDEIWITSTVLSANDMTTLYNSQNNPTTFAVFQPREGHSLQGWNTFRNTASWTTKTSGYDTFRNTASWLTKTSGYNTFQNTPAWVTKASGWNRFESERLWTNITEGWDTFSNQASWLTPDQGWNTFGNTPSWTNITTGWSTFNNQSSWSTSDQGWNTFINQSSYLTIGQGWNTFGSERSWLPIIDGWSIFNNQASWMTERDGWVAFSNQASWLTPDQGWNTFGAAMPVWTNITQGWNMFNNTAVWTTEHDGWNIFSHQASYTNTAQGWNTFSSPVTWIQTQDGYNTFGNASSWTMTHDGWNTFENGAWQTIETGWNCFENYPIFSNVTTGWNIFNNTASWLTKKDGYNTFSNGITWVPIEQGWSTFRNTSSYIVLDQGWNTFGNNNWTALLNWYPKQGDVADPTNFSFMALIDDTNGTLMNLTWEYWNGSAWVFIATQTGLANGTYYQDPSPWLGLLYNHTYRYRVTLVGTQTVIKIIDFTTPAGQFVITDTMVAWSILLTIFGTFLPVGYAARRRSAGIYLTMSGVIFMGLMAFLPFNVIMLVLMVIFSGYLIMLGVKKTFFSKM